MMLPTVADPAPPVAETADADSVLAQKHAPVLMLDRLEPAPPLAIGFSVIRNEGPSPSSKFMIRPPSGGLVIEYAIWHDWDIEHLYDLEHVWVHLDADGTVFRVEGSMHGVRVSMDAGSGLPEMDGERPVLSVEPGKHALWAVARIMPFIAGTMIAQKCGVDAGSQGIHLGNRFAEGGAYSASTADHRLARLAMKRAAFSPSFDFVRQDEQRAPTLAPWSLLEAWIPKRMNALIANLGQQVPHLKAIFLDCGDTLIDEATEEKIEGTDIVSKACEIPFAMDAVRALHGAGYRLALVADGPRETFENLLKPRNIWSLMDAQVISGDVGACKPSQTMFAAAMEGLELGDEARQHVVMVGNNLSRDIKGANAFGLISLFVGWSKRRTHEPADQSEVPDFSIDRLDQLVATIEAIELGLPAKETAFG